MPNNPTIIHVAGWASCKFFTRTAEVAKSLGTLFPNKYVASVHDYPDREAYREYIGVDKADGLRSSFGSSDAASHTSSPMVWLDEKEYIGGCDATIAWARQVMQPATSAAPEPAIMADDGFASGHGYEYDIVVIGGGSGGLACSKECAKLGAKTAVLDFVKPSPLGSTWGLGGTCVNVGCIPKKLMHQASLIGELIHADAPAFGWTGAAQKHDWATMRSNVQDHIRSLNFKYRVALREGSVTYLNKLGSFVDEHTLELVDKKGKTSTVTAARFIVAVGGRPSVIDCPGGEHAISSDDLFSLEAPPGKTCVVGAGYVSLECAGFLAALGHSCTILVRSILLRGFDRECCDKIEEHMTKHPNMNIVKGVTPSSIEKQPDGKFKVTFSNGKSDVFDTVMAAVGRTADTASLGLGKLGVKLNPKNDKIIAVNEQSSVPHVYALGDVVDGKPELTPVAIQAGILLAKRLCAGGKVAMDYDNIATAVFTPLEYGSVGLNDEEAAEKYGNSVESYVSEFLPLEWSLAEERASQTCFVKVLVNKDTAGQTVLGMHYLGPNAGEITQGYATAIKLGVTYADLMSTVGIHPTTAEEFTTIAVTKSSGESAAKGGC